MKKVGMLTLAATLHLSVSAYGADQTLVSTKAGSPIVLDGMADKAWEAATAITVTLEERPMSRIMVTKVSVKQMFPSNLSTTTIMSIF